MLQMVKEDSLIPPIDHPCFSDGDAYAAPVPWCSKSIDCNVGLNDALLQTQDVNVSRCTPVPLQYCTGRFKPIAHDRS